MAEDSQSPPAASTWDWIEQGATSLLGTEANHTHRLITPNSTYHFDGHIIKRIFPVQHKLHGIIFNPISQLAKSSCFNKLPPQIHTRILGYLDFCFCCKQWITAEQAAWNGYDPDPVGSAHWICMECDKCYSTQYQNEVDEGDDPYWSDYYPKHTPDAWVSCICGVKQCSSLGRYTLPSVYVVKVVVQKTNNWQRYCLTD